MENKIEKLIELLKEILEEHEQRLDDVEGRVNNLDV